MMFLKLPKFFFGIALTLSLLLFGVQAHAAENLASGTFTGASGHATSGKVTLVKTSAGLKVVLGDNFEFDGAPDPKVGFGKNGEYDGNSQLDVLRSNSGAQSYNVPASLDVDGYNEIYIWCKRYSVPLGVAKIK